MKIINLLIAALLALTMASCGHKRLSRATDRTETTVDSSHSASTTTIVSEVVDTLVEIPATVDSSEVNWETLIDSSIIVIDNDDQAIELRVDPIKRTIRTIAKVKKRDIPITIQRTTVTQSNEESDYKSETKTANTSVERDIVKPLFPSWLWLIIFIAGLIALVIWLRQKIPL